MSIHQHHIEMIDAYLAGQLNPEETARLMKSIEQDPALKEEFLLQQSTVKALQDHRRIALKSRLDSIEVGTGFSFTSTAGFKMMAGAALVAAIGAGAYFGYTELNEEASANKYTEVTTIEEIASAPLVKEEPVAKPKVEEAEEIIISEETVEAKEIIKEEVPATDLPPASTPKNVVVPTLTLEKETIEAAEEEIASTPAPKAANNPEVIKPDVLTDFEETDITASTPSVDVPQDQLAKVHSFDNSTISVSTKANTRYDFHYRFFDNQLQIFGDFSKVPYEVLEVNTGLSTSYYLYHNENYYELKPNQEKITLLQELKDRKTIKELEITRTKKLNK